MTFGPSVEDYILNSVDKLVANHNILEEAIIKEKKR